MSIHPQDRGSLPGDPMYSIRNSNPFPLRNKYSLPPYRVFLLSNSHKDMMFIVRTIMELTRFARTEALHKMWQAQYDGRSVLIVTHKERAELFVELFADRGVIVGMEPV